MSLAFRLSSVITCHRKSFMRAMLLGTIAESLTDSCLPSFLRCTAYGWLSPSEYAASFSQQFSQPPFTKLSRNIRKNIPLGYLLNITCTYVCLRMIHGVYLSQTFHGYYICIYIYHIYYVLLPQLEKYFHDAAKHDVKWTFRFRRLHMDSQLSLPNSV